MRQKGFGLIIVVIAVAVILLLAGGGVYFSRSGQKSQLEVGNEAIEQAKEAKDLLKTYNDQLQEVQENQ